MNILNLPLELFEMIIGEVDFRGVISDLHAFLGHFSWQSLSPVTAVQQLNSPIE